MVAIRNSVMLVPIMSESVVTYTFKGVSVSEVSEKNLSGRFITAGEACALLDQCEETSRMEMGSLSLHWLRHDTRGDLVMVQGGNGEFALIQSA